MNIRLGTFIVSIIAVVLTAVSAKASDGFVTTSVWDKYSLSNSGVLETRPVLQTFVLQQFRGGCYGSIFGSAADRTGYGNEIDWTIGMAGGKDLRWDVNLAYWDLTSLGASRNDLIVVTASLSHEIPSLPYLTAGFTLEAYEPTDRSFWDGGWRGTLKMSGSKAIRGSLSLNHEMYILRDDGSLGSDPSFVTGLSASLAWKIGRFTISPVKVKASAPLGNVTDGRRSEITWGTGFAFAF
jgi:hypothetical protein